MSVLAVALRVCCCAGYRATIVDHRGSTQRLNRGAETGGSEMLSSTREPAGIDKLSDVTLEIREFVRQDPGADSQLVADNLASLLQRVAGTSVQEIDYLIGELQTLREKLQYDETRVQHAIARYTNLSQSTLHSTKVISECLANWKQSSRRFGRGTVGAG
jgi:hypothetical protein